MTILDIRDLNVRFRIGSDTFHAVKDFSLKMERNETVALVGESGSGKSVVVSAVFGILEKNAEYDGSIIFDGTDLSALSRKEFDAVRRKRMVLIPQNVSQAWDPLMKIGKQMVEFIIASGVPKEDAPKKAEDFLSRCGFADPKEIMETYPHRLSGGMSQRAMIAMCMSAEPELVVADEPTKGLDESVRDSVLDLLLSKEWGASLLMITHDLHSASRCGRIDVMYGGRCVESGTSAQIMNDPLHPYTRGLMDSDPSKGLKAIPFAERELLPGDCVFANRCSRCSGDCRDELVTVEGREVRCHRIGDL